MSPVELNIAFYHDDCSSRFQLAVSAGVNMLSEGQSNIKIMEIVISSDMVLCH